MKAIAVLLVSIGVFGFALALQTNAGFQPRDPPICPEPNGSIISFPNPDDCSTFYVCVGYEPVIIECQNGTWYNPDIMVCDWPSNIEEGICIPPVEHSGDGDMNEEDEVPKAEMYNLQDEIENEELPYLNKLTDD